MHIIEKHNGENIRYLEFCVSVVKYYITRFERQIMEACKILKNNNHFLVQMQISFRETYQYTVDTVTKKKDSVPAQAGNPWYKSSKGRSHYHQQLPDRSSYGWGGC